jgi:hopanoid-associated phosphorylase
MILAATGLRREARIVAGPGVVAVSGGGVAHRLEAALESSADTAEALISFGVAGALAPGLRPGDCVIADRVICEGDEFATDPAWALAMRARLPKARGGAVFASDVMLLTREAKQALGARTGAVAVDMESHVAARLAARLGLPFAVIRAISDDADRNLPAAVAAGMAPDGGMAVWPVLWALARSPGQTPGLIRTAIEAERAFRSLADARHLLGPRLGRPDLGKLAIDVS